MSIRYLRDKKNNQRNASTTNTKEEKRLVFPELEVVYTLVCNWRRRSSAFRHRSYIWFGHANYEVIRTLSRVYGACEK